MIVFPIYWVPQRVGSLLVSRNCYEPQTFPIYWVPQRVGSVQYSVYNGEVTVFPIYWVPQRVGSAARKLSELSEAQVSNLLGSPASGERNHRVPAGGSGG